MSVFRTLILIGLGAVLVPTDAQQREQMLASAAAATHWTATFCSRNAELCEQAKSGITTLAGHAAEGTRRALVLVEGSLAVSSSDGETLSNTGKRGDRLPPAPGEAS